MRLSANGRSGFCLASSAALQKFVRGAVHNIFLLNNSWMTYSPRFFQKQYSQAMHGQRYNQAPYN